MDCRHFRLPITNRKSVGSVPSALLLETLNEDGRRSLSFRVLKNTTRFEGAICPLVARRDVIHDTRFVADGHARGCLHVLPEFAVEIILLVK